MLVLQRYNKQQDDKWAKSYDQKLAQVIELRDADGNTHTRLANKQTYLRRLEDEVAASKEVLSQIQNETMMRSRKYLQTIEDSPTMRDQ